MRLSRQRSRPLRWTSWTPQGSYVPRFRKALGKAVDYDRLSRRINARPPPPSTVGFLWRQLMAQSSRKIYAFAITANDEVSTTPLGMVYKASNVEIGKVFRG